MDTFKFEKAEKPVKILRIKDNFEENKAEIDQIPCHIEYNGTANVTSFFRNKITKDNSSSNNNEEEILTTNLYGRELKGKKYIQEPNEKSKQIL